MPDIIHLLPDAVANQIAAGEVIQRPASIIKELVENAIDAHATRIQVVVEDAGKSLVQVIDNGCGMSGTDARLSFERHATSKIAKAHDLFGLRTMGFRGEALASIAAVAQVELRTRQEKDELGTCILMEGSRLISQESIACPVGANFAVRNVFFNIPARRKFLKSNQTELSNIMTELERIALANPDRAFSLHQGTTLMVDLPKGNFRQRIVQLFGRKMDALLVPVEVNTTLARISGFVGTPKAARRKSPHQFMFVNGRFMKHPYFHKALMQAYEQLIPAGEQPSYFVYFTLDPATIDVNIHPTKTEIKFENEQPIWQILMAATRESLAKSSAIPTIDFDAEGAISIPVYNPTKTRDGEGMKAPKVQVDSAYNPFDQEPAYQRQAFDWTKLYEGFERDREAVGEASRQRTEEEQPVDPATLDVPVAENLFVETTNPCFQYKGRYILTAMKSGLAMIDQHRAHLRILFEQYSRAIRQKQGASQQVLFPEVVTFTPAEVAILPALWDDLRFAGFDLSDLGGGSYAINGLPAGIEGMDMVQLLKEIVARCVDLGTDAQALMGDTIAQALAKAAAIPAGKELTPEEMDHLIASLFSCQDSNLTPDGKIILSMLTDEELERRFR